MKSSRRLFGLAALVIAVLATTSTLPATQAKTPQGAQAVKWWQSDFYKKELGLTAEQTRRLEEIFQSSVPGLKGQKSGLDDAEARFEKLVQRGDDKEVMEQVNLVEAARADLNKTRTLMLLNMRKVLTRDQWAKFTALHQAVEPGCASVPAQNPPVKGSERAR
jgi:Spy/CpxP family protein refolding chaperone